MPSHCVECRVSLKADFVSGMWSSIYKCTSLLNSSVINIAHQYWTLNILSNSCHRFKRIQLWSMHLLYRQTFLACLLIEWIVCSSGSLLWGKPLPANAVLYSTWLWLRILISGPSFKFDSVEWCRKLPIPRSIDWDEKFNKTEGKGGRRTSSNIYRLIRPWSKVCVERRLRK